MQNKLYGINELNDFIEALLRRKISILTILTAILLTSIALTFVLPTTYESTATIVIENQNISSEIVESTITGHLLERLESIKRKAFAEENIWIIAEKNDLFFDERNAMPHHIVADIVQGNTVFEAEGTEVFSARGTAVPVVLSLNITYSAETAEQAQGVANDLAALIIEVNNKQRLAQSTDVSEFLAEEANTLKLEISQIEDKLAKFKQTELQQLPENKDLNLKILEKTGNDILATNENIRALIANIDSLQAELSITKPHADIVSDEGTQILSANDRLSALTAEFLRVSAKYTQKHPDVIRLKREIQALGGEGANVGAVNELINRLTVLREQYSQARQKYSDDHPDVTNLNRSILSVEKGLRNASLSAPRSRSQIPPDNPRFVTLNAQLNSARNNLSAEQSILSQLHKKSTEYEQRLSNTPAVEREYSALTRDYEHAKTKYREVKDDQLEADIGGRLEAKNKGESMELYKSAFLPSSPASPNRLAFIIIGIFLGLICGIGYAAVSEFFDQTVHGSKAVVKIFNAPPLAIIPYMDDEKENKVAA